MFTKKKFVVLVCTGLFTFIMLSIGKPTLRSVRSQSLSDRQKIEQSAGNQIEANKNIIPHCETEFEMGDLQIENEWAFLSMICWPSRQTDPDVLVPSVIILGAAHKNGDEWIVQIEYDENYGSMLQDIPSTLLPAESKISLANSNPAIVTNSLDAPSIITAYSTGLPWQQGTSWYYRQSIHGSNSALDLANPCGTVGQVRAADSGTVVWAYETCMLVRRSDGLQIGYQHLNSGNIATWKAGDPVSNGQLLGSTTLASGCSGSTAAHHVHFWLEGVNPNGSTFGGWTLNDPYFNKGAESRYPNLGCVDSGSSRNDMLYAGTSSCCGCTNSAFGTNLFPEFGSDHDLTNSMSLSLFGPPDPKFDAFTPIYSSSEIEPVPASDPILDLDYAPEWLLTLAPIIKITNEPSPPHLSWPEAIDETGKAGDYLVYWGDDPEGTAVITTTITSMTPAEQLNPTNTPTTRYLRVAARDDTGHTSEWQTMTVWQYDPVPPTGTLTVGSGGDVVNILNVRLILTAEDEGSQITQMRFSDDGQTWSEWEAFIKHTLWQLEENEQPQTIYAQVQDEAGNVSEIMRSTVTAELALLPPASTNYTLFCHTFGMGGGSKSSSNFTVNSTTGQSYETGTMQSGSYQINSGYWSACGADINSVIEYRIFLPFVIK